MSGRPLTLAKTVKSVVFFIHYGTFLTQEKAMKSATDMFSFFTVILVRDRVVILYHVVLVLNCFVLPECVIFIS